MRGGRLRLSFASGKELQFILLPFLPNNDFCSTKAHIRAVHTRVQLPFENLLANHMLPVIMGSPLHEVSNRLEEIDEVVRMPSEEVFKMTLREVRELCVDVATE